MARKKTKLSKIFNFVHNVNTCYQVSGINRDRAQYLINLTLSFCSQLKNIQNSEVKQWKIVIR